jgi:hypothetical protein
MWLDSIFRGADEQIQARLEQRACEVGDREWMLGGVATAVNTLQVAITEAREAIEGKKAANVELAVKRVHDNPCYVKLEFSPI